MSGCIMALTLWLTPTSLHFMGLNASRYLQCKLVDTTEAFKLLKTDLGMELIEQLVDVV